MTPADDPFPPADIAERKARVKQTLRCPWCDSELLRVDVEDNPFSSWDTDVVYLCVRKDCVFAEKSRETMAAQGIPGGSYRFIYIPDRDWCGSVAENTASAVRTPRG